MSNDTNKPLFNVVAIIGIGLIGSSIARAIKKYGLASKVYGYAKTNSTRDTAKKLGAESAERCFKSCKRC